MRWQPPLGIVRPSSLCVGTLFADVFGCLIWLTILLSTASVAFAANSPAFVQEKDNQVKSGTTSRAIFSAATIAGNLLVVYVIWDSTGSASVSDSLGNAFASAVGPTRWNSNKYSAQIFYAINVRGGSDSVTATFSTKISRFGIVYAHEYSGINQSAPLDVTAAAAGTAGSLNSGSAATTNAMDLLFGGAVSAGTVTSPGTGYTARSKSQGNMTEDRVVSAQGSYSATATNGGGAWAMQMAAFRGSPSTTPSSLTAVASSTSSINLSWVAPPAPGVNSYVLQRCQGAGCSSFVQIAAPTNTNYADAGLASNTSYSYRVAAVYSGTGQSPYSNVASATTLPSPPSAPGNLAAVVVSSTQINLSWNASSSAVGIANYVLQRCQGAGCSNFATVATPTGTAYNDTGLSSSTTYNYQVKALDTAGNPSPFSNLTSATTLASPPSAPGNMAAVAASSTQINLSWSASSSAMGIANYVLQRCQGASCSNFATVATPTPTVYNDTGLSSSTTYNYRVKALDTAGNSSSFSNVASATTTATLDTQAPTVSVTAPINNQPVWGVITVSANATDDVAVVGVQFQLDASNLGAESAIPPYSVTWDTSQTATGSHVLTAVARDGAGNTTVSFQITVQVGPRVYSTSFPLTENPIFEGGHWINGQAVGLDWGDINVITPGLAQTAQTLASSGFDHGTALVAGTWGPDQTVEVTAKGPSVLGGTQEIEIRLRSSLAAHYSTGYEVDFTTGGLSLARWNGPGPFTSTCCFTQLAGADVVWQNGDVLKASIIGTLITVFRNGSLVLTHDTAGDLAPTDGSGGAARYATGSPGFGIDISNVTAATDFGITSFTASDGSTPTPSEPGNMAAVAASSTQINLSWSASSSAMGIANYVLQRCQGAGCSNFATVATPTGTVYNDTGLSSSTTYNYQVKALDTAGNPSPFSNLTSATTLASPPSAPDNMAAVAASSTQINLSWSASSSAMGIANYVLQRCQGASCSNFATVATPTPTVYNDTGLSSSTTYNYRVKALDTAGNSSSFSNVASATTTATLDTQAPTVSVTAPINNQPVWGVITVSANATDDVAVVGVQFQLDASNLGAESAIPPYSVTWDTSQTASGSHVLTAVARDGAGNTTVSSPITVQVGARVYSTSFPLTENPISEGSHWINGQAVGIDWHNIKVVTPGLAQTDQTTACACGLADGTALVAGTWGPDQTVQVTAKGPSILGGTQEIEMRLRSSLTTHYSTGYEVDFTTGGLDLVRWNGPGPFTPTSGFTKLQGANVFWQNGDTLKAQVIGTVITVFRNGTSVLVHDTASDTPPTDGSGGAARYATGSPGFGIDINSATAATDFGITSFIAANVSASDINPPSAPANLAANIISASQIGLTWSPSLDDVGVAGYQVLRNNIPIANATSTSFIDNTVVPSIPYAYTVTAFDTAGNISPQSLPVTEQTSSVADITPPSVPAGIQSSKVTSTAVTIGWSPSTDDVLVTGYQVFRDGTQVGTTTTTSYTDTGLVPSTTYSYTVAAFDGSNNVSGQSQSLLATTTATPVVPPSFRQVSNNQISSGTSVSTAFGSATQAHNTIVVYIIWNNRSAVTISDSLKSTFVNVGGPVIWGSGYSAQIFYASNVAGGADTVTVAFGTSVTSFGVLYIHEYAGISAVSPIDVTASASGSSASLNSGSAVLTSPNDLIFGAGVSDHSVTAAGSAFIPQDMAYGNITEDRIATSVGSYAATATHNGKYWGMQMVAFRAAQ